MSTNIRMERELLEALRAEAARRGISLNALIVDVLKVFAPPPKD